MGSLLDQVNNITATESTGGEIERGAWDNLFVSMERSFYNIVDLSATSVRKLSSLALDDDDIRKQTGAGWIGRNAGTLALSAGRKAADPSLAPETDPEVMDKFAELLGTTIPYTAAAIAGGGVGGAIGAAVGAGTTGLRIGAALASFSSMREDAYRNAIETGAEEGTANTEANIVGGIQALLEMAQIGGILKQSKTGGALLKAITLSARNKSWTQVLKAGGKLSMGMVRTMTEEALQEALQGTTAELVPKLLRGKEIEPGFAGRRLREAASGALIGGIFGGIGSLAQIATGKGEAATIPSRPEIESMSLEDPTVEQQSTDEFEGTDENIQQEIDKKYEELTELDDSLKNMTRNAKLRKIYELSIERNEEQRRLLNKEIDALIEKRDSSTGIVTEQTSDIPEESDVEFSEEAAEGETVSNRVKADAVVEGKVEVEPVVEEMAEPDTRTDSEISIDKLNEALGTRVDLKETRQLTEAEQSQILRKRVGAAEAKEEELIREGMSISEAHRIALGELSGEYDKAVFSAITADEMTPIDFENIRVAIRAKGLQFFEKTHALAALNKLQDGIVPTESEMRDLGKVIGVKNAEALIQEAKGPTSRFKSFMINLINFPTTTLASSEISFIARQGITTLTKWPKQWLSSLNASYRSYFSSEWADMMQTDIQTRPTHEFRQNMKVDFLDLDTSDLTKTEERYMSSWAKKIPLFGALVRASERAAVVGMNKLRADIFDYQVEQWKGTNQPTIEYKRLAEIVNMSTGRGNISNKKIQAILPFLNGVFFSPRYVLSRFEMVGKGSKALVDVATGKATASQKILASELVNFVIAGGLAMILASMMGAKVERDPRSSDFGKIQLGRTRVDVWAGFQQIARTTAQLITGKGKAISSKELFTKNRLETFGRFVQSKLSPAVSLLVELSSGKTFLGEPIPEFKDKADLAQWALYQKLAPLVLQDTIDAFKYSQNKAATALALPLAFHGIGVQTFETNALDDLSQMRNQYSVEVFGKEWDDIGPLSQKALRLYKPQIEEQERISSFERRNAVFDVKRQREAGVKVEKSLSREVRDEMDDLSLTMGGLSRTITRNWRLNGTLYKKYQTDLGRILNKILSKVINNPNYQALPPQMRQRIMEKLIKQSKAAVRKSIVMTANMNDLEDVRRGVEDD